jgi:hypothetical protein
MSAGKKNRAKRRRREKGKPCRECDGTGWWFDENTAVDAREIEYTSRNGGKSYGQLEWQETYETFPDSVDDRGVPIAYQAKVQCPECLGRGRIHNL